MEREAADGNQELEKSAELRLAIAFPEDGPSTIAEWDPRNGQTS